MLNKLQEIKAERVKEMFRFWGAVEGIVEAHDIHQKSFPISTEEAEYWKKLEAALAQLQENINRLELEYKQEAALLKEYQSVFAKGEK